MCKLRLLFSISALCVLSSAALTAATYNVRDFGATGDGTTKDTRAFQKALDTCAVNGGGEVLVPQADGSLNPARRINADRITLQAKLPMRQHQPRRMRHDTRLPDRLGVLRQRQGMLQTVGLERVVAAAHVVRPPRDDLFRQFTDRFHDEFS